MRPNLTASASGSRPSGSRQRSRGSAGYEHAIVVVALALAGVGGFGAFGFAAKQAIGGSTTGSAAGPAMAAVLSAQAGEGEGAAPAEYNPADPLGLQAMSREDLDAAYQEMNAMEQELMTQLEGIDTSQMTEEELAQLQAQVEAEYSAIDGQRSEIYGELVHKQMDENYASKGAETDEDKFMGLLNDYLATGDSLTAKIAEWEAANGKPCINAEAQTVDEGCAADEGISFLLTLNDAQQQDLDRRMFELGLEIDPETGGIVQLVDDQGRPIRRHWQGTWSLNGLVVGPDGGFLSDEAGNPLAFPLGVDPAAAISGAVAPIGSIDAEGNLVEADTHRGSESGFLSGFKNFFIGAGKEAWDMVWGLGTGAWRVGWDFIAEDLLAGALNFVSGDRLFKGFRWSGEDNPIKSITNFASKTIPGIKAAWDDLWAQGEGCFGGGSGGFMADARGQSCGRIGLAVASLFIPVSKVGTAGKAGAAAGKAGKAATVASKAGSVLQRIPGRGLLAKGGKVLAESDSILATAIRAGKTRVATRYEKLSANMVQRTGTAAGEGSLATRWRAHRAWKNAVEKEIGRQPHLWRTAGRAFKYEAGANPAGFAAGLPFRVVKELAGYPLERVKYWRSRAAAAGGYTPERFGRWYWNNRDYTGPVGLGAASYNHANDISEGMDAKYGGAE